MQQGIINLKAVKLILNASIALAPANMDRFCCGNQ
jgi:hypothetical protein